MQDHYVELQIYITKLTTHIQAHKAEIQKLKNDILLDRMNHTQLKDELTELRSILKRGFPEEFI